MSRMNMNFRQHQMATENMTIHTHLSVRSLSDEDSKLHKKKVEILERFYTYRLLLGILGKAITKDIARHIIIRADMNPDLPINKLMNSVNKFGWPPEIVEYLFECMLGSMEELIIGAFK